MKKIITIFILILSVFFARNVFASTIYGQTTDETGVVSGNAGPGTLVGSFITSYDIPASTTIEYNGNKLANTSGYPSCGAGMSFTFSTNAVWGSGLLNGNVFDSSWAFTDSAYHDITGSYSTTTDMPAGTYYYYIYNLCGGGSFNLKTNTTQDNPYGLIIANINNNTRIQDVLPVSGSITTTTTVSVGFKYRLNDPDTVNYPTPPTTIALVLHRTDTTGTPDINYQFGSLTYNALTTVSTSFSLPTASNWEVSINLSGGGYYFISPLGTPTTFSVITDPTAGTTGSAECSITAITGCFQNALQYLFYPTQASISQFSNLVSLYQDKPPFGYIKAVQDTLKSLNDTGTSVFTLQSMPILNTYIFTPLRTALAWVLWLAFAFVLYHRFKNIQL